jgi:glycosyltransferase involved in cell wall biosynthesis
VKVLTLAYGGIGRPPLAEIETLEAADRWPRVSLYQRVLNSDMLDEQSMLEINGTRGSLYRRLPSGLAQAIEGFARRSEYDAIVSWGEHLGIPTAALLKASGARVPHVALFSWISRTKKAALLRRVHSHIHRVVVWSSAQYECALKQIGIPESRLVKLQWLVDQKFWRPTETTTDMICAVGREMRDYSTLVNAIADWNVHCHIAAKVDAGKTDPWMRDLRDIGALPPHITVGSKAYADLRALYARSRFVVIPLYPSDTDNGVTVMTEAMAMGKAVICSRVVGQRDVLEDGVNGIFVPPQDPAALRQAIEYLWAHPEVCERMGREGRKRIERFHTLDRFVSDVASTVQSAIGEARA